MAESTESTFFQWFTFIMVLYVLVIAVINVFEYNKLATGNSGSLSNGEATTLFWLNVIIIVVIVIFLLWGLIRYIAHARKRAEVSKILSKQEKETSSFVGQPGFPATRPTFQVTSDAPSGVVIR